MVILWGTWVYFRFNERERERGGGINGFTCRHLMVLRKGFKNTYADVQKLMRNIVKMLHLHVKIIDKID